MADQQQNDGTVSKKRIHASAEVDRGTIAIVEYLDKPGRFFLKSEIEMYPIGTYTSKGKEKDGVTLPGKSHNLVYMPQANIEFMRRNIRLQSNAYTKILPKDKVGVPHEGGSITPASDEPVGSW